MSYEEWFIESSKIPKPLSKSELHSYLKQYKNGDSSAREEVIMHNIRLVLSRVSRKFANTPYDIKDLVSIGIVGLIKGVDTFDIDKNFEFSTYAARCIDNEILIFLRKWRKTVNDQSIYKPIAIDENGDEKKLEDILEDDTYDFVSEYEEQITYNEVRKIVYNLPSRDRAIILLYFGFIDNHTYTQGEIAERLGISQCYVSRLMTKIVQTIGRQLQDNGVLETVKKIAKKQKSSLETNFTVSIIDNRTIKKSTISEEERENGEILIIRSNLDNPVVVSTQKIDVQENPKKLQKKV